MAHLLMVACDRCLRSGDRVEATEEIVVGFDHRKPRMLDLCAEHAKPYVELREFAESDGVTVKDGAPTSHRTRPRDTTCPECGKAVASGPGLASHTRMAHPTVSVSCPECGRSMPTAQSLAIHRQAKHGAKKRGEL